MAAAGVRTERLLMKAAGRARQYGRGRPRHFQPEPCLVLMIGVAGSGKTTLAHEILSDFWAVYLDNNQIVDAFFPDTRNGRDYERLRPNFYQALYAIAEANLRLGNSVLLDAPHVKEIQTPSWRRFIKRLSNRTHSTLVILRCLCSEEVLRSRLLSRGEKRDRWKLRNWREFLGEQPIDVRIHAPHLDLDTHKPVAQNALAAISYIRRRAQSQRSKSSSFKASCS
jgi:predicted kinase